MTGADYTPPAGMTLRHVECWRAVVGAGRLLAKKPTGKVPGFKAIIKDGSKACMPRVEFQLGAGNVFFRLIRQLDGWSRVAEADKPARAVDLAALAEAVAQALGDPHDEQVAARLTNPMRPRADLDN